MPNLCGNIARKNAWLPLFFVSLKVVSLKYEIPTQVKKIHSKIHLFKDMDLVLHCFVDEIFQFDFFRPLITLNFA